MVYYLMSSLVEGLSLYNYCMSRKSRTILYSKTKYKMDQTSWTLITGFNRLPGYTAISNPFHDEAGWRLAVQLDITTR